MKWVFLCLETSMTFTINSDITFTINSDITFTFNSDITFTINSDINGRRLLTSHNSHDGKHVLTKPIYLVRCIMLSLILRNSYLYAVQFLLKFMDPSSRRCIMVQPPPPRSISHIANTMSPLSIRRGYTPLAFIPPLVCNS